MATKLFVGGLSWDTTEDTLREAFEKFGTVVSAVIIKDKFTDKSKGFGFVEMASQDEANAAIQQLNGSTFDGRSITVNEARPMTPRDNNGRSGGYNRGGGGGGRDRDRRGGGYGGGNRNRY